MGSLVFKLSMSGLPITACGAHVAVFSKPGSPEHHTFLGEVCGRQDHVFSNTMPHGGHALSSGPPRRQGHLEQGPRKNAVVRRRLEGRQRAVGPQCGASLRLPRVYVFMRSVLNAMMADAARSVKRAVEPNGKNGLAAGRGEVIFSPRRLFWDSGRARLRGVSRRWQWVYVGGHARKFTPAKSRVSRKSAQAARSGEYRIRNEKVS